MDFKQKNNKPDLVHELELRQSGCSCVAGLDEAGRGAWAGPVVAAAVVLPIAQFDLLNQLEGIKDSKLMTHQGRLRGEIRIREVAISIGIGSTSAEMVDEVGIIKATRLAMMEAITSLDVSPSHLLIDHIPLPEVSIVQTVITKGDLQVLSIAAASVIAKVTRDSIMVDFGEQFSGYGFSRHKGYGTKEHQHALADLGPTSIHRYSFAPVAARNFFKSH
ncbi:MAG: ribonuclease HII [Anaerolineales bacterium]